MAQCFFDESDCPMATPCCKLCVKFPKEQILVGTRIMFFVAGAVFGVMASLLWWIL
jgi:hypothetical protein